MTEDNQSVRQTAPAAATLNAPEVTPTLDFQAIAKGSKTVLIRLDETVYTLRLTKNKRLILQK